MKGFDDRFADLPDYIVGITREIWEDRGIGTLNRYYAPDIVVRTPMGVALGNQATVAATMATLHEFPDRQLYAEDVIWSGDDDAGFLSSHRIISTGTHLGDGQYGTASGRRFRIRVIADCAAKGNVIDDEWLVRDYGGLVRQLGLDPQTVAADLVTSGRAAPFTPAIDQPGPYRAQGNDSEWGQRYADSLRRIMAGDFTHILRDWDRAMLGEYPGARSTIGTQDASGFWLGLRSAFPSATFTIHHQIGMEGGLMPPRAAIRWSLQGRHDGWGAFGRPTGAEVHVMGISHAEFGPWGLRREYALYDEIAIWTQILMAR